MADDYTRRGEQGRGTEPAAHPPRVAAWKVLGGAVVLAAALFPIDGAISRFMRSIGQDLGGDVRRELETLQQYGALGSVVLIGIVIWLMDPARRARLFDWAGAMLITAGVALPMKMLIGRPRPRLGEPSLMLGPLGTYDLGEDVGRRHAWEVFSGISSDLWSMPSSHTAFATVLSVFLMTLYPRLRGLALAMIGVVGIARVLFGAHYPSDVVIGGSIGWVASTWAMRVRLGTRLAERWLGEARVRAMERSEPARGPESTSTDGASR